MKKAITLIRRSLCLMAAAALAFPSVAVRAEAGHPVYKITFAGRGESKTVDEVLVENLSNGQSASLRGQDTLLLKAKGDLTAIGSLHSGTAGDLRIADGRVQLALPQPSSVQIAVYTMDGRLAWQTRMQASSRSASVALPPLAKGVYVVRATAPGLEQSVKWAGGSALTLAAGHTWDAAAAEEQPQAVGLMQPLFAADAEGQARGVEMEFALGDMLRLTGTSGQMRTITMNSPRSSHPIHFDFFRCEDSDGYNYTIVRVGDQLWMAEDLHAKQVEGVTRIESVQKWQREPAGYPSWMLVLADDNVYYTKTAAERALPKGWSLPTQGEVDYLVKKLGGYSQAGRALKSRGTEWPTRETSLDASSAGFVPHGDLYSGTLNATDQARYVLRSTHNLLPTSLVLEDGKDRATVMHHVCRSVGFHVRGMRSAPSAYTEMMEKFNLTPRNMPARVKSESKGPLGDTYIMKAGMQSVAFDFGGGQYRSANIEKRSGILSCRDKYDRDPRAFDFHHNAFADQDRATTLRKMTAMTSPSGRQYIVEGKWSRHMRLWTQVINGKYKRTDTPDVFGDGTVTLEFYGDSAQDYRQLRKVTLPDTYNYPSLPKGTLKYFLYDDENRTTESRIDYVQRYFQILAADFNEDGVDDILINVNGDVYIYDGAMLLDGRAAQSRMAHRSFRAFASDNAPVRVALGDVNSDGVQDVLVMRAKAKCILTVCKNGDLDNVLASTQLPNDGTNTWFIDLKVGRVTNSTYPEIVTLMRDFSGTTIAHNATMNIYRYRQGASGNLETVSMDGNNVGSFRGNDGHMGNCNITLPYLRGQANPCDIIVGADLWAWDAALGKVKFVEQVLGFVDKSQWSILADHIIAADVKDTGQDGLYYFATWNSYDRNAERYSLTCMCDAWFEPRADFDKEHKYIVTRVTDYDDKYFHYGKNGTRWENSGQLNQVELMWWFGSGDAEWGNAATLCAVNDRTLGKRLKFKSRQTAFSEPRIHAMLAAPPTFTYGEGEQDPGYDFVTSWGYSRSTSTETTKSSSISSSAILGFELEINAPITGQKIAGMDFTTKIQQECTSSTSSGKTVTYSQQYEARDDDRVVIQVTPYTVYTYVIEQAENPDEIGGDFIIAMPGQSRTIGLAVQDFQYLMADAPGTPDISQVFAHNIGDPYSYPASSAEIRSVGNVMWGNGKENDWVTTGSGGSVIREIALDETTSHTAGFTFGVETELVVTTGCVKAGAGFGYNDTNETTHSEGKGFAVSACVPGLASGDRNPARSFFDWNLCWYKYTLDGQTFPVVNYIVKPKGASRVAAKHTR